MLIVLKALSQAQQIGTIEARDFSQNAKLLVRLVVLRHKARDLRFLYGFECALYKGVLVLNTMDYSKCTLPQLAHNLVLADALLEEPLLAKNLTMPVGLQRFGFEIY